MLTFMDLYDNRVARDLSQERSRKAAAPPKLAPGAKSTEESKILVALRASPMNSEVALARETKLNETAVMLSVRSLLDRNLIRWETNSFGGTRLVAIT